MNTNLLRLIYLNLEVRKFIKEYSPVKVHLNENIGGEVIGEE